GPPFHKGPQTTTVELARHPQASIDYDLGTCRRSIPTTKKHGGEWRSSVGVNAQSTVQPPEALARNKHLHTTTPRDEV
ncbi:hypothetical protein BHE74_00037190, partial [Ensete ventricosum]